MAVIIQKLEFSNKTLSPQLFCCSNTKKQQTASLESTKIATQTQPALSFSLIFTMQVEDSSLTLWGCNTHKRVSSHAHSQRDSLLELLLYVLFCFHHSTKAANLCCSLLCYFFPESYSQIYYIDLILNQSVLVCFVYYAYMFCPKSEIVNNGQNLILKVKLFTMFNFYGRLCLV